MAHLYRTTLRPAHGGGLPAGLRWEYVEAPALFGLANRPDLPTSQHRYGVISTDRKLTPEEMDRFDVVSMAPEPFPQPVHSTYTEAQPG